MGGSLKKLSWSAIIRNILSNNTGDLKGFGINSYIQRSEFSCLVCKKEIIYSRGCGIDYWLYIINDKHGTIKGKSVKLTHSYQSQRLTRCLSAQFQL